MSSIIEGYNYDIFISYRQKDNKGDHWVSDFVEALKTELESTFKEEISLYFDINPHDGLLETHDVDASLKEKLKCLIFIPIISRTYCDPKSFAWEHEFKAFVEMASKDQFGLKVKLSNGNVTSRILPVRIHDLDNDDIKICESILEGVLRGIEFIYKEPGVNRPLSPKDEERKNLNNTVYRNQINKVALAVKELIPSLKSHISASDYRKNKDIRTITDHKNEETAKDTQQFGLKKNKLLSLTAVLVLIAITFFVLYKKKSGTDELASLRNPDGRITVVVLPFQNMTNDTIWNVWQDGIQNELINRLSGEDLIVRQFESTSRLLLGKGLTNYSSITPSIAASISQELNANVLISGNIKQAGFTIRITAQITEIKTLESLKSFQADGTGNNIFNLIDTIGKNLKNFFLLSELKKQLTPDINNLASSNSPEAYRYFIYGNKSFFKGDFGSAIKWFLQALDLDSSFFAARLWLTVSFINQGSFDKAKNCFLKINKKDLISLQQETFYNTVYSFLFETPFEEIKYLKQILEIDDQAAIYYYELGRTYNSIGQYENAISEHEKSLELYKKWGIKPIWVPNYTELGFAYCKTSQYKKAKDLYVKAEQDFPNDPDIIYSQAVLSLILDDTTSANSYLQKYKILMKGRSISDVNSSLGLIYSEAGVFDKAEECFRKVLQSEPENPEKLVELASFLIDNEININEGIDLSAKALLINPDNYYFIHVKGRGLIKQKKYKEALELLEKSWELKPIYDYSLFKDIEEVKKALAESNNNL